MSASWLRLAEAGGRPALDLAPAGRIKAGGRIGRSLWAAAFHGACRLSWLSVTQRLPMISAMRSASLLGALRSARCMKPCAASGSEAARRSTPRWSKAVESATLARRHQSANAGSLRHPSGKGSLFRARGQPWASGWASGVVGGRVSRCEPGTLSVLRHREHGAAAPARAPLRFPPPRYHLPSRPPARRCSADSKPRRP